MADQKTHSDEEFFKERGFGLKIGFGERPALIVIDMIKAFTNPQAMLGANLDVQIEATKPLLAAAHERGIPVFFSTVIYNDADLADAGIWALKQKGVVTLKGDTDGGEVDPRLDMRSTDSLLVKKYASCFFGTDLVSRLVSRRIDTLIITGCHHQRLRTRHRRRCGADGITADGRARGGRRPFSGRARAEPVRSQRQICGCRVARRDFAVSADSRSQFADPSAEGELLRRGRVFPPERG